MLYIEKIKIVDKGYPGSEVLKQGFEIICSEVNLFVGNQGCGKSTLLTLMQQNHSDIKLQLTKQASTTGVTSLYFDSEKNNPRTSDPNLYVTANGVSRGIGYGGALRSRFMSHGEVLENFTVNPLFEAKDAVILLDEPESGLSITNQMRLIDAIKTAAKNNCQLFIATHCYPLIEAFDVISLEHNKQMAGKDFIRKVSPQPGT